MVIPVMSLASLYASNWRADPFSGRFTAVHVLPHIFGTALFFTCVFLQFGSDYKGAWIFLLAPARAFRGFARGVYALLWIEAIVTPHLIMLIFFAWFWGIWHAGLFAAYSLAVASVYLALELRLIGGAPFSKQADPSRGANLLPLMIGGGMIAAIAVGVQYLLVFRSPAMVIMATAGAGLVAWLLTRSSLGAFEVAIRYELGMLSAESGTLYQEIDV